jgi:hypothetical protein
MDIMKLAEDILLAPYRFGADGKTASVLENSNAIASAGNSTLEPSASERKRGTCDCCSQRPWTHHFGAHQTSAQCETYACCECANCDGWHNE